MQYTSIGYIAADNSCRCYDYKIQYWTEGVFDNSAHDDVIKWNYFPRYWPFVRGIHRSPANSPNKGQWRGALMFSLICAWINGWVNNRDAGDLRRHRAHYDVTAMHVPTYPTSIHPRKIIMFTLYGWNYYGRLFWEQNFVVWNTWKTTYI